jgi:hypothetical protein
MMSLAAIFSINAWADNTVSGSDKLEEVTDNCRANYSINDGDLYIPCVDVLGTEVRSQAMRLQLVSSTEPWEFVTTAADISDSNSTAQNCRATFNDGELFIPCIDLLDSNGGDTQTYEASLEQSFVEPMRFTVKMVNEKWDRGIRRNARNGSSYDGNWEVPYLSQVSNNYAWTHIRESACGPTSVAMLLRFYFPNSHIDMPEIYQAGTQTYSYHGPAIGYKNISFAGKDGGKNHVDANYRSYYSGNYSGMTLSAMEKYLQNIWGIKTKKLYSVNEVYSAIRNGPLLGHVYGHGNGDWGHYVVIRGIDEKGTASRNDDTIYINDPYDVWNSTWDNGGKNKALSYSTFFVKGRYANAWFRDAIQFTPNETAEQRKYTVVVDTGHNAFAGGNSSQHQFHLQHVNGNYDNWKYYYGGGGDWYYPTKAGYAARWTPHLSKKGYYQVSVKFRGDNESGNVTYTIYDSQDTQLKSITVNQYKSSSEWTYQIIAEPILLENGAYVRASNISADTNVDAVKFKYLRPYEEQQTSNGYQWHGNGSLISYHGRSLPTNGWRAFGIIRDTVQLHKSSGKPVGLFQWQVNKTSCNKLKLYAEDLPSSKNSVDITIGTWSGRSSDITFSNVKLPFVLGKSNTGWGARFQMENGKWYVVKVALRNVLSQDVQLHAICSTESPTVVSYRLGGGDSAVIDGGYKWNGSGSVISNMFSGSSHMGGDWPHGAFKDMLKVRPSPERPMVFFQWQHDSGCSSLTLDAPKLSTSQKRVDIYMKPWDAHNNEAQASRNETLPYTLYDGSAKDGSWSVIQMKFLSPVSKTATVTAKCPGIN